MTTDLLITWIAVFLAFLGEGCFGFGAGMIALPILSQIYPVKTAVMLMLSFQIVPACLLLQAKEHLDWQIIKRTIPATVIGVLLGAYALSWLDDRPLRVILGLFIIAYLLKEVFWSDKKFGKNNPKLLSLMGGGIGGFLQGMIGIGGPGFLVYLNELGLSRYSIRASILSLFLVCNIIRAGSAWSTGMFTPELGHLFLKTIPIVLIAIYLGYKLHFGISEKIYRRVIYTVLGVSAFTLLKQAISS